MRIRYRFPVQGMFRLSVPRSSADGDAIVQAELTERGTMTGLVVTFPFPDWKDYEESEPIKRADGVFVLNVPDYPRLADAERIAKRIEARLTPFGVEEIATDQVTTNWVADSDDEKPHAELRHSSWSQGVPENAHALYRPGVLRAALRPRASDETWDLQLAFYRAAWAEVRRFQYVKAFSYFFFFLEGLFGDSQIKSDALKKAFREDVVFARALARALEIVKPRHTVTASDIEKAVSRIVDRRGFLFHNPSRRKEKWSPDDSSAYAADTMLLAHTASSIVLGREWPPDENALPTPSIVLDADRIMFDNFFKAEAEDRARADRKTTKGPGLD